MASLTSSPHRVTTLESIKNPDHTHTHTQRVQVPKDIAQQSEHDAKKLKAEILHDSIEREVATALASRGINYEIDQQPKKTDDELDEQYKYFTSQPATVLLTHIERKVKAIAGDLAEHENDLESRKKALQAFSASELIAYVEKAEMQAKYQEAAKHEEEKAHLRKRIAELEEECQRMKSVTAITTTHPSNDKFSAGHQQEIDTKLEELFMDQQPLGMNDESIQAASATTPTISDDPFNFVCPFGFTGKFEIPAAPPTTRTALLISLQAEINATRLIQAGLGAYAKQISKQGRRTFSANFVDNQVQGAATIISQLDQVVSRMEMTEKGVINEAEEVGEALVAAFKRCQLEVAKSRAILVHAHVFFKLNSVPASE